MLTLIRKDVRLLRPVLVTAVLLAVLFYGVMPWPGVWELERRFGHDQRMHDAGPAAARRAGGAWYAWRYGEQVVRLSPLVWVVGLLLVATVAGTAFAAERRERWADFTAMLPVRRGRAVGAKLAASLGVLAAVALAHLAVLGLADGFRAPPGFWMDAVLHRRDVAVWAAFALGMFGVGWLGSAVLNSPVTATAAALALVAGAYGAWLPLLREATGGDVARLQAQLAAGVGVAGLAGVALGTLVQCRRASP